MFSVAVAHAAEPKSQGAAMLDALRDRDPAIQWDAAGDVFADSPVESGPVEPLATPAPATSTEEAPALDDSPFNDFAVPQPALKLPGEAQAAEFPPVPQSTTPLRTAQREAVPIPYEPNAARADIEPIARTPDELRKIGEILPYDDYQPDETSLKPPQELALGHQPFVPRSMPPSVFAWKASNLCHHPLYFEDPQLERYGHTYGDCVQPLVSLGRFSVQVVGLPYQMALDPPCKDVYSLGYYRPGEPAPKLQHQVPFNARAAALAAVFYTGVGVVLP